MSIVGSSLKETFEMNTSLFEQVKNSEACINFLKIVKNTDNIFFESPELYKKFIKKVCKANSSTANNNTSLREKALKSFRKSHGLPKKAFDQNVVVRSKGGAEHRFSKELLILSSTYFENLFNSGCKESIPENGIYNIQLDLSDTAIESLLEYFLSKKIPSEDVDVLHELLAFAHLIQKTSFMDIVSEKIITILIDKKNRAQFSPQAISGIEDLFLKRYLSIHNIEANPKFSPDLVTFVKLFCTDDLLSEFLSKKLAAVRFNNVDYAILCFLPEKCRRFVRSLRFELTQGDFEKVFKDIYSIFPNLRTIRIAETSIGIVEEYFKLHPDVSFTKCALAITYSFKHEKKNETIPLLEKALEIDPENAFILANLGECYQNEDKFDKAKPLLKKALEIDSKYTFALSRLGNCYLIKDDLDKAKSLLEKAFELDLNNDYFTLIRLGSCYGKKNEFDKARPLLKEALEINPNDTFVLWNLADCCRREGKFDEAIPFLEKAFKVEPNDDAILSSLGNCYRKKGEFDKAILSLEKSLKISPDSIFTLSNLVDCHLAKSEFDKAIFFLERILKVKPNSYGALNSLSECYEKKDESDKLIPFLEKALEINPNNVFVLWHFGDCYRKEGKFDEAISFLEKALEFDLNDNITLGTLGDCYRGKGEFDKAISFLEKALEIQPNDGFCLSVIGDCYREKGEFDKAMLFIEKALKIDPDSTFTCTVYQACIEDRNNNL